MKTFLKPMLRPALMLFLTLTVVTGVLYPLAVTVSAQVAFPYEANGSIVSVNGAAVGSALIGQQFIDPGHFWGRPSATGPYPYNAAASGGSNLGPLNPALTGAVQARIAALRAAEMRCDALLKGTSVDGVYDADPKKDASAKRYETVDYDTVLSDNLKVMDASAVALCRDNNIPIVVFSIREKGNLARVLAGEGVQTIVQKGA